MKCGKPGGIIWVPCAHKLYLASSHCAAHLGNMAKLTYDVLVIVLQV